MVGSIFIGQSLFIGMLRNPFQFSISALLMVTFLVAIGLTVGPTTWFLIATIECVVFYLLISAFDRNLPKAIAAQMDQNRFRADGSVSSKRERIEKYERKRFVHNVAFLLLLFLVATNIGLLTLRVDRLFEGAMYVVDSPEIIERPGRKISESQYANEIGAAALRRNADHPVATNSQATRNMILLLVGSVWCLSAVLLPLGYLGMLKRLAMDVSERAGFYRVRDFQNKHDGLPGTYSQN